MCRMNKTLLHGLHIFIILLYGGGKVTNTQGLSKAPRRVALESRLRDSARTVGKHPPEELQSELRNPGQGQGLGKKINKVFQKVL